MINNKLFLILYRFYFHILPISLDMKVALEINQPRHFALRKISSNHSRKIKWRIKRIDLELKYQKNFTRHRSILSLKSSVLRSALLLLLLLFPRESFVFFKSNSIDNNRPLSSVREKWNQYELRGESQVCRLRRSNAIALLNDVDNLLPRIPQIY